ncbi:MAG: CatB-related O-acetyltransferase [Muribaculaceae bacterium]|nr:CatB-related O-acetyltransferase [Muribaculaceae bacterium]
MILHNIIKVLTQYVIRIKCRIKYGSSVKIASSSSISIYTVFEGMNQIHQNTVFNGFIGFGSYIGPNSNLNGKIGRFTSIGPLVRCNFGKHPYTYPFVSTAPCFYSLNKKKTQNGSTYATSQSFDEFSYVNEKKKYAIEIGSDCWIGEGVFFAGGITVGDGAVILAHSVITKDIPPYAIVGGIPSKIIKYRYSEEDIDFLLKIKWWNNSRVWFEKNWMLLNEF